MQIGFGTPKKYALHPAGWTMKTNEHTSNIVTSDISLILPDVIYTQEDEASKFPISFFFGSALRLLI